MAMMNREVKFRAWDSHTKQMLKPGADVQSLVGRSLLIMAGFRDTHNEVSEDALGWFEFMQYTGLKDKNGVEAYDKDIIKMGPFLFTIEWADDTARFYIMPINKLDGHKYTMSHLKKSGEVIGNIYENPELLK